MHKAYTYLKGIQLDLYTIWNWKYVSIPRCLRDSHHSLCFESLCILDFCIGLSNHIACRLSQLFFFSFQVRCTILSFGLILGCFDSFKSDSSRLQFLKESTQNYFLWIHMSFYLLIFLHKTNFRDTINEPFFDISIKFWINI